MKSLNKLGLQFSFFYMLFDFMDNLYENNNKNILSLLKFFLPQMLARGPAQAVQTAWV